MSIQIELFTKTVDGFLKNHAKGLPLEEKEDLRQDILLALIEEYKPGFGLEDRAEDWVNLIATAVLREFRDDRRSRSLPPNWGPFDAENLVPDSSAPNLDLQLDMRKALERLPPGLRNIAVDLFYRDLSQKELADKYLRTQPWVAAVKKQIVNRLHSFLKEKPCR